MYIRWYADNLWLFVPIREKLKAFGHDFLDFPYQAGASLNAAGIGYQTVTVRQAMQRLGEIEQFTLARN
jgi:arylsulfatase